MMGKQEALEEGLLREVVVHHPVCQVESFEPSQMSWFWLG